MSNTFLAPAMSGAFSSAIRDLTKYLWLHQTNL